MSKEEILKIRKEDKVFRIKYKVKKMKEESGDSGQSLIWYPLGLSDEKQILCLSVTDGLKCIADMVKEEILEGFKSILNNTASNWNYPETAWFRLNYGDSKKCLEVLKETDEQLLERILSQYKEFDTFDIISIIDLGAHLIYL